MSASRSRTQETASRRHHRSLPWLCGLFLLMALPSHAEVPVLPPLFGDQQEAPISLKADRLEYRQDENRYEAEGNVVLEQGEMRLTADRLVYDKPSGDIDAVGHVVLRDGTQLILMDRLEFNLRTQAGVMYEADLFIPEASYRLTGRRIERAPDGTLRAEEATFTTCDTICELGKPSWQFRAKHLRVRLDKYLVARGVTLRINDVTVAYLPWLIYPVMQERQSGLLIPTFGFNSTEGFQYTQPFYWVIGRSHDATFALDLRTRLGIGLNTEYRYRLSQTGEGLLTVNAFHNWNSGEDFLAYHAEHEQRWPAAGGRADRFTLEWNINIVNRQDLFIELSDDTVERSRVGLESTVSLTYRQDEQLVYVNATYTQNLAASDEESVQRLPEVGYRLIDYRLGPLPLYAGMEATAVHFYEGEDLRFDDEGGKRALRVDLFPTVTARLDQLPGLVLTSTAGFRETYYRSSSLISAGSVARELFILEMRAESQLTRQYSSVTHLIAPALVYEYAHQLDDAVVPQFDEVDAAPEKRQVTLILTNRVRQIGPLSARSTSRDLFWLKLSESYNLRQSDPEPVSNLRIQAVASPVAAVVITTESFVNMYGGGIVIVNSDLRWTITEKISMTLGQRYTRRGAVPQRGDLFSPESLGLTDPIGGAERIAAISWGGQLALPWRLTVATQSLYDLEHGQFTKMSYGLRWQGACNVCWAMTLFYQQFPEKRQVSFFITLRGLTGSESKGAKRLFHQ